MSAYNAVAPSSLRYYNFISVGDAANVTIKGGSGAVALQEDLDAAVGRIEALETATNVHLAINANDGGLDIIVREED